MSLAHGAPLSGHTGWKKTAKKILQHFYWPGLNADIKRFCQECQNCQKSGRRNSGKAPLIPLPVVEEPFKHVAIDIV